MRIARLTHAIIPKKISTDQHLSIPQLVIERDRPLQIGQRILPNLQPTRIAARVLHLPIENRGGQHRRPLQERRSQQLLGKRFVVFVEAFLDRGIKLVHDFV